MYRALLFMFFFKQKTAYEMRISDWSSDVCSSDLAIPYQFKEMIDSGFIAGGGNVAPHFRLFYAICVALALATALRFYFVSWLGERTVADIRQAVQRNLQIGRAHV